MTAGGYDLEEIRQRADIVEIISPHVTLRKAGRRLVGLCPFHQEKTPSFTVDPESGLWHCFGCKAGGDLFRFVEMIEKVTFREAVELLARKYGIAPLRKADAAVSARRDRMIGLHADAARFFQHCLTVPAARRVREYVASRGMSDETVKEWGLGYAPPTWDALLKAMRRRGHSVQDLVRAGLAVARDDGAYDRFRDRLIFPIWDATGRVIAFGGRSLPPQPGAEEQQPKYLNSPETPLFHKGRVLYGLHRARRAMADTGRAVVVEGYVDVIACHEAGLTETVGTLGTALTPDHVQALRRRVSSLVLCFDSDSAGLAAALRGRELFQRAELEVRVVTLPPGLDPDGVLRNQGPEALRDLVEKALPITEWELRRILGETRPGEDLRPEVLQQAVKVLARLAPGVEREYYVRWLAQHGAGGSPSATTALEDALRAELSRLATRKPREERRIQISGPTGATAAPAASERLERSVLAAFLHQPHLAERYLDALEVGDLSTEAHKDILAAISALLREGKAVTAQAVTPKLPPEARSVLAELAMSGVPPERLEEQVRQAIRRLAERRLRREEEALRKRLAGVSSAEERRELLDRINDCRRKRSALAGKRIVGDT